MNIQKRECDVNEKPATRITFQSWGQVLSKWPSLSNAVTGYRGFLAEAQGILSDIESRKPEGIIRAREVVCTIVSRLAIGREPLEPIRELKNFDDYTFTHALNVR